MSKRKYKTDKEITDYRHRAKRKNITSAGLAAHGKVVRGPQQFYADAYACLPRPVFRCRRRKVAPTTEKDR